ncbi:glycosyltransferase family 2 protein [Actinomadura macrotermitis]|nr:glycosyltransferase family A protein [Actinomadura macrotermitis]
MSSASSAGPRIAVVATAAGGPGPLDRLLLSLAAQTLPPAGVLVVDQDGDPAVAALVAERARTLPVRRVAAPPGIPAGRNAGLRELGLVDPAAGTPASGLGVLEAILAAEDVRPRPAAPLPPDAPDAVVFPGPAAWYPPEAFARAAEALAQGADVVSGRLLNAGEAPALRALGAGPVDRRTVWTRTAAGTCFFTAGFLRAAGGFDEELGTGRQPVAEADLLLRGLRAGRTLVFDPRVRAWQDAAAAGAPSPAEARLAGRGTGRVYVRHYNGYHCMWLVLRPLAAAALAAARGRRPDAVRHLHKAAGRVEGLYGVLLPGAPA